MDLAVCLICFDHNWPIFEINANRLKKPKDLFEFVKLKI